MKVLSDLLDQVTGRYAARPALHFIGDGPTWTWTYADLHSQTERIAAALHEQGVGPGTRVIFWAPNSPWWVAAYFAVLRLGAIVVPLDARNTPDFVDRVAAMPDGDNKVALNLLCDLYALSTIEADRGWFMEHGRLSSQRAKAITAEISSLCRKIRPLALDLVDAFGVPEEMRRAEMLDR